jgi:succinate-acetate transporter protein
MSEKSANPAPLGLLGFGMTTVLLNLVHNFGLTSTVDSMILAMGLAYGGLAQVIAGVMEYKKGNTFSTVAFTSYGLFWWSFVALLLLPQQYFFFGIQGPSNLSMAAYFFMWGLFTFLMFFGTLKTNRALQFVFMSLAILFFLLTARSVIVAYSPTTDVALFTRITGFEGVICGLSAVYLGIAEIVNETHGKTVLPIYPIS